MLKPGDRVGPLVITEDLPQSPNPWHTALLLIYRHVLNTGLFNATSREANALRKTATEGRVDCEGSLRAALMAAGVPVDVEIAKLIEAAKLPPKPAPPAVSPADWRAALMRFRRANLRVRAFLESDHEALLLLHAAQIVKDERAFRAALIAVETSETTIERAVMEARRHARMEVRDP